MARLENWSLVARQASPYQAPEQAARCLHGNVYGHPDGFEDGAEVTTSRIETCWVDSTTKVWTRTHSGTEYELGEPHPDYEKAYPDAYARTIAAIQAGKGIA